MNQTKENKKERGRVFMGALRYLPLIFILAAAILYIIFGSELTSENLLSITPSNKILAILFILALSAAKSLSFFFPFFIIEVLSSLIFPGFTAIMVNMAALAVCFATEYLIGRLSGAPLAEKLRKKYKKLDTFQGMIENNNFMAVFAVRIVGILPMDAVGMYFGAIKLPFFVYLLSGLIGSIPDVTLETLIGAGIRDVTSPYFAAAIGGRLLLTVLSLLIYRILVKKNKIKRKPPQ